MSATSHLYSIQYKTLKKIYWKRDRKIKINSLNWKILKVWYVMVKFIIKSIQMNNSQENVGCKHLNLYRRILVINIKSNI